MLWIRAVIFSLLAPFIIGGFLPWLIGPKTPARGFWQIGWVLVLAGFAIYLTSLRSFVRAQGTPAIFFTRRLRLLFGEEPKALVRSSLYSYTRNPMYLAVTSAIFGQAFLFASTPTAIYGLIMFALFHLIVTLIEEPHLGARDPEAFREYCRTTPRWLGLPRGKQT